MLSVCKQIEKNYLLKKIGLKLAKMIVILLYLQSNYEKPSNTYRS
jgi:hypothetical protein